MSQLTDKKLIKIIFYTVISAFYDRHQAQPSLFMGPSWSTSDRLVHSYFKSLSSCHYLIIIISIIVIIIIISLVTISSINVICIVIFITIAIITSSSTIFWSPLKWRPENSVSDILMTFASLLLTYIEYKAVLSFSGENFLA